MKTFAFAFATLNEERHIGELLDSLNRQTYPNTMIVVVDGGSKDNTVNIAREKGATVIIETGKYRSPSNAWNIAAKKTHADYICIIGVESFVTDRDFVTKAVKMFGKDTGALYAQYRTPQDTLVEKIVSNKKGMCSYPTVMRRDVFLGSGGFPVIGVSEDVIVTERIRKYLKKKGMKEKYTEKIYYYGHAVQNLRTLFKQTKWYGRTSLLFMKEFLKETKSYPRLIRTAFSFYSRMLYLFSFLLTFLFPINILFAVPFILFLLLTIVKNLDDYYHLGKIFTNLVAGAGLFVGLMSYILGINRSRSRQ